MNLPPPPESTVVHVSVRSFAPTSNDEDMKKKMDDAAAAEKKSCNVVRKINNLVMSDLDSIMSGRDFWFIGGECARGRRSGGADG